MSFLEFIIPCYKRQQSALRAVRSVAEQIVQYSLDDIVSIRAIDDASPDLDRHSFRKNLNPCNHSWIEICINETNKGMSKNIFDSVKSSNSTFCTILTDDDALQPAILASLVSYLKAIDRNPSIAGLITPRYSYLENGTFQHVSCLLQSPQKILSSGAISSVRYAHLGFILTGFIFRPSCIDYEHWSDHIDNGFFPIINLSAILFSYDILYLHKNWFRHTVFNTCHWSSWGSTTIEQNTRLYHDYLAAIDVSCRYASTVSTVSLFLKSIYASKAYLAELSTVEIPIRLMFHNIEPRIYRSVPFVVCILPSLLLRLCKVVLTRIIRIIKIFK